MIESNDQEWGLCDHYLVAAEFDDDAEDNYGDAWDEFDERDDEDDESPWEHLARVAAEIEAGRAEVPRGWKLNRRAQASWCGPPPRVGAMPLP
jgi:hypothetical protein